VHPISASSTVVATSMRVIYRAISKQIGKVSAKKDLTRRRSSLEERIFSIQNPDELLAKISSPYWRLQRRLQLHRAGVAIGKIVDVSDREIALADAPELLRLATLLAEGGAVTQALSLFDKARKEDRGIYERQRYLGLTVSGARMRAGFAESYQGDLRAAEHLKRSSGTFEELVRSSRGRVAIVGNSPIELGKSRGEEIDSHEIVIRFNNFSTDAKYERDYGKKTDVWVRSITPGAVERRPNLRPRLVLFGLPVYWRKMNSQDTIVECAEAEQPCEEMPAHIYRGILARVGTSVSAGLAVIHWVRSISQMENPPSIFGFSMIDQEDNRVAHYFGSQMTKKPAAHDWITERKILDDMLGKPFQS
jgi:hypothetical protein